MDGNQHTNELLVINDDQDALKGTGKPVPQKPKTMNDRRRIARRMFTTLQNEYLQKQAEDKLNKIGYL